MKKKLIIYYNRMREQLWLRPLLFCLISIAAALLAHQADGTDLNDIVPIIDKETVKGLLDILSDSMLVISIFAVASMIAAFSAATDTATPRSFRIVVTDDVSQYALSTFIAAFIFSIVATLALDIGYYDKAGKFILFIITLIFFVIVILSFLQWVNRISRLGRLENTIMQIERVVTKSLATYIKSPTLYGLPIMNELPTGESIYCDSVGYVQHINMEALQELAKETGCNIRLNCIPGTSVHENSEIAYIVTSQPTDMPTVTEKINEAIYVGHARLYDDDPRFGLIALSEIASRALSPGINDPGTAIQIIGTQERLLFFWNKKLEDNNESKVKYDLVEVPTITMDDFFADAFRPISRDGASNIEVMLRLQKAYNSLATINDAAIKSAAIQYSEEAFKRAALEMKMKEDLEMLEKECLFRK